MIPEYPGNFQLERKRAVQIGQFYDQVFYVAMKAGLIQLVRPLLPYRQVDILVTGYQGMHKDLGRNAEHKQQQ